jgi:hypothetical protein
MNTTYTNPRSHADFNDWPSGRLKTRCTFEVEPGKKGERVIRTTVNPKTGRICAPKKTVYYKRILIVDGDDDRTYLIGMTDFGNYIKVIESNLKYEHECLYAEDPRYKDLLAMFDPAHPMGPTAKAVTGEAINTNLCATEYGQILKEKAQKAWDEMPKDDHTMIRFGMFPDEVMKLYEPQIDALDYLSKRPQDFAVALMNIATSDGGMVV